MTTHKKWVLAYFITFIVMIVMNYTVGMTGSDVGGTANDNETIIQPAGFAFSICCSFGSSINSFPKKINQRLQNA